MKVCMYESIAHCIFKNAKQVIIFCDILAVDLKQSQKYIQDGTFRHSYICYMKYRTLQTVMSEMQYSALRDHLPETICGNII